MTTPLYSGMCIVLLGASYILIILSGLADCFCIPLMIVAGQIGQYQLASALSFKSFDRWPLDSWPILNLTDAIIQERIIVSSSAITSQSNVAKDPNRSISYLEQNEPSSFRQVCERIHPEFRCCHKTTNRILVCDQSGGGARHLTTNDTNPVEHAVNKNNNNGDKASSLQPDTSLSIMEKVYFDAASTVATFTNLSRHLTNSGSNHNPTNKLTSRGDENSFDRLYYSNPLMMMAEAKGVAGMGKTAGVEGQGGSDKAGQRVPRETYLALSYACTWILFTLSVPVIFYGLNKILGKVKICCGCKKKCEPKKQLKKKPATKKQHQMYTKKQKLQQQSTQSLITTISGQISQHQSTTKPNPMLTNAINNNSNSHNNNNNNNSNSNSNKLTLASYNLNPEEHQQLLEQYHHQHQQGQSQYLSHPYLNEYFSNNGFSLGSNTNESFRSKVKAPKLKQLEPQATIGKYHLQQQHQLEMLHNSLMSNNLAYYQQQQQQQQQSAALSNNSLSQQDFDHHHHHKTASIGQDKARNNCYSFQQLNGYNLSSTLKPTNCNSNNKLHYTNLYNINNDGLLASKVGKSSPNVVEQQPQQQTQKATIKAKNQSKQQCSKNLLAVDYASTTTSSSTSSKSNGSKSKELQIDSLHSFKSPLVIPYKQFQQHQQQQSYNTEYLDRMTSFGPMNHSRSMNLTDLNSYNNNNNNHNTSATVATPPATSQQNLHNNSDFLLLGAKTLSHYPDLKLDGNFDYSLMMRDNMAQLPL